jgi:hypothetical protein
MAPDGARRIVWMIKRMIKADCHDRRHEPGAHLAHWSRYAERMTVRDMLTALQALPRDVELMAFQAGCEFSPRRLGSAVT